MRKKDERLYIRLTHNFPEHEKIYILSDAAFRALVEMTAYSAKMLTDGRLSKRLAHARWSLEVCQELLENASDNPSLFEDGEDYVIHDFCEHQLTKADIEEERERRREAGRKGGLAKAANARAGKTSKRSSKPLAAAKQMPSKRLANGYQSSSKTCLDIDIEIDKETPSREGVKKAAGLPVNNSGTRLPDGWRPSLQTLTSMQHRYPHIDLDAETEKFLDHWHSETGTKAMKHDWDATWRNWIRRAEEYRTTSTNKTSEHPISRLKRSYLNHDTETPF